MRRLRFGGALLGALAIAVSGCATHSAAGDITRVAELSGQRLDSDSFDEPVDDTAHSEVRTLLSTPLTADKAVQIALLNNRELRAQLRQMGVARGHLMQANLLPNPVIGVELPAENEVQWEASLEFDLSHALMTPLRADAARPAVEAARIRGAAAVVETGARVRKAFFDVQASAEQMALARDLVDAYAAGLDAANALVDSGNAATIEQALRSSAYEQARTTLAVREQQHYTTRERLQRLLGLSGKHTEWKLDTQSPLVPEELTLPDDLESRVLRVSLDLRATREELEGLARGASLQRTLGRVPDVAVEVSTLRPARDPQPGSEDPQLYWGAGVNVAVPLFDRRQGNVVALQAQFDAESERLIGRAVDLRSTVREVRFRLESAHARVAHYRSALIPAQRSLVEQTLLQVNAMQASVFTLLQVRRAQLEAELDEVSARRDYYVARADLDALLAGGRIDPGSQGAAPTPVNDTEEGGH